MVTPQIIYPFERVPAQIRENFPANMHLSHSKSGWNNGVIFLEYITDVYHPHIIKQNIKLPVILFVDGHSSHVTLDVYDKCEELKIMLVRLLPNATYLMQPADVSCFKSLKVIWKKGISDFKATDISRRIQKAIRQITAETVKNAFRTRGIYPFDYNAIDYSKCLGSESTSTLEPVIRNDQEYREGMIRIFNYLKYQQTNKQSDQQINHQDDQQNDEPE